MIYGEESRGRFQQAHILELVESVQAGGHYEAINQTAGHPDIRAS